MYPVHFPDPCVIICSVMSIDSQQPEGPSSNPVIKAAIVAFATMVITTLLYHAPGHWITGVIILSLTAGLIAYVWLLSREFSLRCLNIAGTALFALLSNNIIPNFKITGNWGETSFGFKIESIDVNLNWILGIIVIVFGILAFLWRILRSRQPQPQGVGEMKSTGPKSPTITISGDNNTIVVGDQKTAGRDVIHGDQIKAGRDVIQGDQNITKGDSAGN